MLAKVFRGKNWKLASEQKWEEDNVRQESLGERVGCITFDSEEYGVHVVDDGFAAVKIVKEEVQKIRWIVNAAGGNINRHIAARDEVEARKRLEQICTDWKTVGVLYMWKEDGSLERICTHSYSK